VKVLHLIRPESGPWPKEIAVRQAAQGDRVLVLRWRDGEDDQVACDVLACHGESPFTAGMTIAYRQLLDLLFESDRLDYW